MSFVSLPVVTPVSLPVVLARAALAGDAEPATAAPEGIADLVALAGNTCVGDVVEVPDIGWRPRMTSYISLVDRLCSAIRADVIVSIDALMA